MLVPKTDHKGRQYTFYGAAAELQTLRGEEVIIAGPADTGKTLSACYLLNRWCWEYPGAQIAIVRKTAASLAGSVVQTYKDKILLPSDQVWPYGGEMNPQRFIYPNGSVVWLGGLDKASKVLSSERDVIYVNQAEELALYDWEILRTRASMRTGNMPFAMLFGDCNPGPPLHWIKQLESEGILRLINSTHRDNPEIYDPVTGELTPAGEQRLAVLQKATGVNYKRLFLGQWAATEGAIYEVFDEDRHKVKSFPVPHMWPRVVGVDPYGAMVAGLYIAFDPEDMVLHVYREYAEPFGLTTPQHARNMLDLAGYDPSGIKKYPEAENIFAWIGGGPSENQARLDFRAAGIPLLEPGVVEVWSGIDKVIELISTNRIFIHDCCIQLLSEIGSYKRKMVNGQPTDAIENKDAYHLLDCLRYAIAWLTRPREGQTVGKHEYVIGFY